MDEKNLSKKTVEEDAGDIQNRIHALVQLIIHERSEGSWDSARFWFLSAAQALSAEKKERAGGRKKT